MRDQEILVESQGNVTLSADKVGRDKISGEIPSRTSSRETVEASSGETVKADQSRDHVDHIDRKPDIIKWITSIPALVKLAEFVRSFFV